MGFKETQDDKGNESWLRKKGWAIIKWIAFPMVYTGLILFILSKILPSVSSDGVLELIGAGTGLVISVMTAKAVSKFPENRDTKQVSIFPIPEENQGFSQREDFHS